MNRQNSKTAPVIKKVAPPTVPDFRHSGSSFGSAGYSSSGEDTFSISTAPVDANKGNMSCLFLGFTSLLTSRVISRQGF